MPTEILEFMCNELVNMGARTTLVNLCRAGCRQLTAVARNLLYKHLVIAGKESNTDETLPRGLYVRYPRISLSHLARTLSSPRSRPHLAPLVKTIYIEDYELLKKDARATCDTRGCRYLISRLGLDEKTQTTFAFPPIPKDSDYSIMLRLILALLWVCPNISSFSMPFELWDMPDSAGWGLPGKKPNFSKLKHLGITSRKREIIVLGAQDGFEALPPAVPPQCVAWFLRAAANLESLAVAKLNGVMVHYDNSWSRPSLTMMILDNCYTSVPDLVGVLSVCARNLSEFKLSRWDKKMDDPRGYPHGIGSLGRILTILHWAGTADSIEKITIIERPSSYDSSDPYRDRVSETLSPSLGCQMFRSLKHLALGLNVFPPRIATGAELARFISEFPSLEKLTLIMMEHDFDYFPRPEAIVLAAQAKQQNNSPFKRLKFVARNINQTLCCDDHLRTWLKDGPHWPALESAGIRFVLRPWVWKHRSEYNHPDLDGFFLGFDRTRGVFSDAWVQMAKRLIASGDLTDRNLHWYGGLCASEDPDNCPERCFTR